MKNFTTIVGILLIIAGIVILGYRGFSYTQKEDVAKFGNMQISTDTTKTVRVPPLVGGLCLVAGVVLIVIKRDRKD